MWSVRKATAADLTGLQDLCLSAVGAGDYALDFLERFVRESTTLVATDQGRLVGMLVADDTPDGGVWLHAARTHPEWRRQGVARDLNRACEDLARRRGRPSLRLWAEARNTASVRAALRSGFEERARFTRMRIGAASGSAELHLEPLDLDRDAALLESSPFLKHSSGYVFHDFYFLPFTRPNARRLSEQGALWRLGPDAIAVSEDFEEVRGKDLQVQLLAGDAPAILEACPRLATVRGAQRVESFLPHDRGVLRAAREAGFQPMEWGREAILFEKGLGG